MVDASAFWFANPGGNFYNGVATQSLRFDRASDPYLNRTATLGNRKTWTFSTWLKRSGFTSAVQYIFGTNVSNNDATAASIFIGSNNKIYVAPWANHFVNTDAVLRDVGAWYHIVVDFDTTQAGSANADRVNIYINGVDQPLTNGGATLGLNTDWAINLNQANTRIGDLYGDANELNGYLAETNFVDGLSLDASYFGETKNGVWIAKTPDVSDYGTNGFRLQFNADGLNESSGAVSSPTNIGDDSSGKNNHFSVSGIVASDCNMPDSPENNFCTMNPNGNGRGNASSFTEGNLKIASTTGAYSFNTSTFRVSSGKWYFEMMANDTNAKHCIGISGHESINTTSALGDSSTEEYSYTAIGQIRATSAASGLTTYGNGDIIGVAINLEDNELQFLKNGSSITTINITAPSGTTDGGYGPAYGDFAGDNTGTATLNCGQDPSFAGVLTGGDVGTETPSEGAGVFKYAPPSGFLALCTSNLEEPTIGPNSDTQATDYFKPVIYNGLNNTAQDITVGFKPDWVWIKTRNANISHMSFDSSRLATKWMQIDNAGTENTGSDSLTDFDVSGGGFSLGADTSTTAVNNNGKTYAAWNWKANGGTTTTNDASSTNVGDRDSVIQANTTAGFSIVLYTGSGQTGAGNDDTYAHGLGVVPEVIICKNRDVGNAWLFGMTAIPSFNWADDYMHLQDTIAHQTNADRSAFSVTPTDEVFSVGEFLNKANNYVAYLFASVEGYSKFGSYTGNGVDDNGTFVHTGFRPAFIITKCSSHGSTNWFLHDEVRNPINPANINMHPNLSNQEGDVTTTHHIDILASGFKPKGTGAEINGSGRTYIYMAFGNSFKYANAR